MRILYAAKHDKGANDNEGAIKHALESLGHEVTAIHEHLLRDNWPQLKHTGSPDLLLFQNWKRPPPLEESSYPKVFWYMDRIDYGDDPILSNWTRARQAWMEYIIPRVTLGVCTDGDWVNRDTSGRLIHLMQGADSRHACIGKGPGTGRTLLFCGSVYGRGEGRASFVQELEHTYGRDFIWHRKCFGSRLIAAIQSAKIVVAPDGPVSDLYFSNRMVITCSFGGFMLHPYCSHAATMYEPDKEVVFYHSRKDLHDKIRYYADRPEKRWEIQRAGFARTLHEHTYKHKLDIILKELTRRHDSANT